MIHRAGKCKVIASIWRFLGFQQGLNREVRREDPASMVSFHMIFAPSNCIGLQLSHCAVQSSALHRRYTKTRLERSVSQSSDSMWMTASLPKASQNRSWIRCITEDKETSSSSSTCRSAQIIAAISTDFSRHLNHRRYCFNLGRGPGATGCTGCTGAVGGALGREPKALGCAPNSAKLSPGAFAFWEDKAKVMVLVFGLALKVVVITRFLKWPSIFLFTFQVNVLFFWVERCHVKNRGKKAVNPHSSAKPLNLWLQDGHNWRTALYSKGMGGDHPLFLIYLSLSFQFVFKKKVGINHQPIGLKLPEIIQYVVSFQNNMNSKTHSFNTALLSGKIAETHLT